MIPRTLKIPLNQSAFLLGPRQVGKTHLIQEKTRPDLFIDLLLYENFSRYSRNPDILQREVQALNRAGPLVVIDEVQRCPEILNVVQSIMESREAARFLLTGSSARKLKRGGANLLAGRAVTLRLHPLTHEELGDLFSLESVLRFGSLPRIILEPDYSSRIRLLRSYVETYLREEIQQEALTRNAPAFSHFLDLAGFENGRLLHFSGLSRELGIDAKTVRSYFQILEDTLIGFFLEPYARSPRAKLVKHPKFFFFDGGVVSALRRSLEPELIEGTPPFGAAFEHWVILETRRLLDYREREYRLSFFRTGDGTEVDLIIEIGQEVWAIEIKSGTAPSSRELHGLRSFLNDHHVARAFCVCRAPRPYANGGIEFIPWRDFFALL